MSADGGGRGSDRGRGSNRGRRGGEGGVPHGSGRSSGRRSGRRPGDQGTRETILAAARQRFGDRGFDGATIRAIAADARVDPALVLHYFGNKADLFAAAVDMPISPSQELAAIAGADREHLGETILRTVIGIWENPDALAVWLGLVRSAIADEDAAQMLKEFLATAIFTQVGDVLGVDDAEYRTSLAASQIVGLGIVRYIVRVEPLASASTDELVAAVAPTVQRYLTGDLAPPPTPTSAKEAP